MRGGSCEPGFVSISIPYISLARCSQTNHISHACVVSREFQKGSMYRNSSHPTVLGNRVPVRYLLRANMSQL